jgi:hypothetical protein
VAADIWAAAAVSVWTPESSLGESGGVMRTERPFPFPLPFPVGREASSLGALLEVTPTSFDFGFMSTDFYHS